MTRSAAGASSGSLPSYVGSPGGELDLGPIAGAFVVLGVCGGIAAYKAVEILRLLSEAGAHVVPVLTKSATRFVGAVTFSALAAEPAETDLFGAAHPIPHTRLGRSADLVLVAPATARLLGEYAAGIASDLLSATLLATRAPVIVCPAMHAEMWEHPAVRDNVATLERRGVVVVSPERGRLAGGDVGQGRLAAPAVVLAATARILGTQVAGTVVSPEQRSASAARAPEELDLGRLGELAGLRVLVTAGGTREPIDPVRYVANRSSGRQGHALAEVAAAAGADVTLVTASELPPPGDVEVVHVETAAELADAVLARSASADVVVMAAAVADFRPARVAQQKLRKRDGAPQIDLEPTEDVLAELGRRRSRGLSVTGQVVVGFAAETVDVLERARAKLVAKGADLVVANDVSAPGVGFGHATNAVTLLDSSGACVAVPLSPKPTIAVEVLAAVLAIRRARGAPGPVGTDPDDPRHRGSHDDEGARR